MSQKYYKKFNGKNWATSYALKPKDLYLNFNKNKYIRPEALCEMSKTHKSHAEYFGRILRYFFQLVLNDIIDNNITFKLPPGTNGWIEMENVTGKDFIKAYQNGAYNDVDFLASNFTGNHLSYRKTTRYGTWKKPIYVHKQMKDKITANTNRGKQYG